MDYVLEELIEVSSANIVAVTALARMLCKGGALSPVAARRLITAIANNTDYREAKRFCRQEVARTTRMVPIAARKRRLLQRR